MAPDEINPLRRVSRSKSESKESVHTAVFDSYAQAFEEKVKRPLLKQSMSILNVGLPRLPFRWGLSDSNLVIDLSNRRFNIKGVSPRVAYHDVFKSDPRFINGTIANIPEGEKFDRIINTFAFEESEANDTKRSGQTLYDFYVESLNEAASILNPDGEMHILYGTSKKPTLARAIQSSELFKVIYADDRGGYGLQLK